MSLLKYIQRLKRMDDLIRRKATGTPDEFAARLGLRKSVLMDELRELKELGAEITYCRRSNSYYYEQEFILKIGTIDSLSQNKLLGGQDYSDGIFSFRYYRNEYSYFSYVNF
jgi:hypothetical protein